jgi:hypothetical protein
LGAVSLNTAMESKIKIYQPRKLINILASTLWGEKTPFHKICTVENCERPVAKINSEWECYIPTYKCVICKHYGYHITEAFFYCPDCTKAVCDKCSNELNLGTGPLKRRKEYIGKTQVVYRINDTYAIGTLLCVDETPLSSVYTYECTINGFLNIETFLNEIICFLIIEDFHDDSIDISVAPQNPHTKIEKNITYIVNAFMHPLSFMRIICRDCPDYTCSGSYCRMCMYSDTDSDGDCDDEYSSACWGNCRYDLSSGRLLENLNRLRIFYYGKKYWSNMLPY